MENNKVTILSEEFENDKTGEKVQGITIIVDGKFKEVVDLLMEKNHSYEDYTEIIKDAIFKEITINHRRILYTKNRILSGFIS